MHFLKFLKIYFAGDQSCYGEKNNDTNQGQGGPKITLRLTLSSIVHFLPRCTIFFIATLVIICWFKMSKINPIFLVIFVLATTEKGTYSKGKDTYVIKWWVEPSKYNFGPSLVRRLERLNLSRVLTFWYDKFKHYFLVDLYTYLVLNLSS